MAEGISSEESSENQNDIHHGSITSTETFSSHQNNSISPCLLKHNNNNEEETHISSKSDSSNGLLTPSTSGSQAELLELMSSEEQIVQATPNPDDGGGRRHSKSRSLPHGVKLCPEGNSVEPNRANGHTNGNHDVTTDSEGEEKWLRLESELKKAHQELQAKDDEVEKLKGIRQLVEDELQDLTSSLFVEAHKMVSDAKMKEIASEKSLREARMQMEGLQAEVAALKALLITSTPSKPNLGGSKTGITTIFKKQHKRTPSHNHLLYGRSDETDHGKGNGEDMHVNTGIDPEQCDIDPDLHCQFLAWRQDPSLIKDRTNFLRRIYQEDIEPCMNFPNLELVKHLIVAVEDNSIWVDPLPEKDKLNVPKECALLRVPRLCHYRMRFAFDSDTSYDISKLCRDRIAAVCEFLNYLRYIKNGLVKASVDDSYWEIIRLRKQLALAKLGLPLMS